MFYCIFCYYSTPLKSNFSRHLKSDKHLEIVNNQMVIRDNTYNCCYCKFKVKSRAKYNQHINQCMLKNINKYCFSESEFGNTIRKKHINDIKSLKKNISSLKKKYEIEKNKNIFLIDLINKLIISNYINLSVFRNKNICKNQNETTKLLRYLNNFKKNNYQKKDENHMIIYLNDDVDKENFLKKIISNSNQEKKTKENIIKTENKEIKKNIYDNCNNIIDTTKNSKNYKIILDCGSKYFYNEQNNIVYNEELEEIGIRKHDKDCPFCNSEKECWHYVEYKENK